MNMLTVGRRIQLKRRGIGITPEAVDQCFPAFDLIFEAGWRPTPVNDSAGWLQAWATRRYGVPSANVSAACKALWVSGVLRLLCRLVALKNLRPRSPKSPPA